MKRRAALRLLLPAPLFPGLVTGQPAAQDQPRQRLAIIKADDVRDPGLKWTRFITLSLERNVVVSLGVIANSIEPGGERYRAWLQKWSATGKVEFWNHGWDHRSWSDASGRKLSEFGGSGYEHQKDHLVRAQESSQAVLGRKFAAFGSPFNAMDADTAKALNELPELELVFCYAGARVNDELKGKTLLPMHLRGEHDGTGKPNFPKFKEDYLKKDGPTLDFAAVQFHPAGFTEEHFTHYIEIIEFLKAEGWTFLLPGQYLELKKKAVGQPPLRK